MLACLLAGWLASRLSACCCCCLLAGWHRAKTAETRLSLTITQPSIISIHSILGSNHSAECPRYWCCVRAMGSCCLDRRHRQTGLLARSRNASLACLSLSAKPATLSASTKACKRPDGATADRCGQHCAGSTTRSTASLRSAVLAA